MIINHDFVIVKQCHLHNQNKTIVKLLFCSKSSWLPWNNYRNHVFFCFLFVVKQLLIIVRDRKVGIITIALHFTFTLGNVTLG